MTKKPDLYKRFYEYLRSVYFKEELTNKLVPRKKLKAMAYKTGYTDRAIYDALEKLDARVDIGSFKDEEMDAYVYVYYFMTDKEIKQKEDDRKWFDSLPDHKPKEDGTTENSVRY